MSNNRESNRETNRGTAADHDVQVEDFLVDWETARQAGREISVAELCKDRPELAERVGQRIAILKQLSWMDEPIEEGFDSAGSLGQPPAIGAVDETQVPDSEVTVDEFVQTLSDSGVLNDDDLERLQLSLPSDRTQRAFALATDLIRDQLITPYQAKVILERGDSPLLLDRYVILDSIGGGGMGIVFKALQRSLERVVAVKVLPKHAVDSAEKIERFQREMRAAARLSHPNVVQAFDAHESNGVYFFAMEYVPGSDLAKLVENEGPLPAQHAIDIVSQAALGLSNAHRNRIIHRDVKPANILLSNDGVAKVLDLGLARVRELTQSTRLDNLTRDGLTMGTVTYMSPEQAFDAHQADERSDIYSLGCTLYYLLHGRPLFDQPNGVQTVIAHRETPAPMLGDGRDDVPQQLEDLFQRMVAKDPAERPQSMDSVHQELVALLSLQAVDPVRESGTSKVDHVASQAIVGTSNTASPTHRTDADHISWAKWIAIAAACVAVVVLGLLATNFNSGKTTQTTAATALLSDEVSLFVTKGEEEYQVDFEDDLPDEPFSVTGVLLYPSGNVDLDRFKQLDDIKTLYVVGQEEGRVAIGDFAGREKFDHLEEISLTGAVVSPSVLEWMSGLRQLTYLDLTDCELPDGWIRQLEKTPGLRELSLAQSDVTNTDLATLAKLRDLAFLDVSNTQVTSAGLKHIVDLPLEELAMTGLELGEDFQQITQFSTLKKLYVDGTNLDDSMVSWIARLDNLRLLHVGHTRISSAGVSKLAALKNVRELGVQGLTIQTALKDILGFPKLRHLLADNTDINDQSLELLGAKAGLKTLQIAETDVTDSAVERFRLRVPACLVIDETESVDEFIQGL